MAEILYIPIDKLNPHPDNPRKEIGDVSELAESIKAKGVLQNLTVVPYVSPVHGRVMEGLYTILIGHRRFAAAKLAGLKELPCVVVEMSKEDQIATMLVENMQRSDLTIYEEAKGFQMMLDLGKTVKDVSDMSGFSEATVKRRVKLAALDEKKFKKAVDRGATLFDFAKLDEIEDMAQYSANTVPVMMPYITAFFMPRNDNDRPKVVPDGAVNFAFLGQFAETARDTIFTTEYSMRTGMEAVYTLLDVDRAVPEVWGSTYDVRDLLNATIRLRDGKPLTEMKLGLKEKIAVGKALDFIAGTDVEKLLKEYGVI